MKILVANRGEIACRIFHTLREMAIPSVAIFTDVDADAPHVGMADETFGIGETPTYLDRAAILDAARKSGATAIHPGYGFLSQNAGFARDCRDAGITFIGPSPEAMLALGDKRGSSQTAIKLGIPVVPGARETDSLDEARVAAAKVGYPILIKAAGGGGGKGMRRVDSKVELKDSFDAARREAIGAFADDRLLVEKYIHPARHVEVQILGDGTNAIALGERECSLQRRYQKVIEESPAPTISDSTRHKLFEAAIRLARAAHYANAGTVEFLIGSDESFYFLEVNSRLQVEHPVTEMLTGLDLVREQIAITQGQPLPSVPSPRGHAIEARLCAEDPYNNYLPSTGQILAVDWPRRPHVRIDSGIVAGTTITPFYDPLLAKIIVWGPSRDQARLRLIQALRETVVLGVNTNLSFLLDILSSDFFSRAETYTTTLESHEWTCPPPPDYVIAIARDILAQRFEMSNGASGPADHYSPWRSLGNFRMGQ